MFFTTDLSAQVHRDWHIAMANSNTAVPFGKFTGLFSAPWHPGLELGYGFNWKTGKKHDWYQQFRVGYFYHRFVQHGIPLYTNFGYRYRFTSRFCTEASVDAGYLHSIPATAKLKLDADGEYTNNKGLGRIQEMVVANFSACYRISSDSKTAVSLFLNYQQRIQTPFVKSYVPLLPYNTIMIGARIAIKNK